MGTYPLKPGRDRGDRAEWTLDECGLERGPRREPRLVVRMAAALNDLQIVMKDPIEFLSRQERKPYPEKPRTTLEEWAEWLLDECGIEHDDQLVRRMAVALFAFQEITCKLGCYWPMPRKGSWEYILELEGIKKEKPKPN